MKTYLAFYSVILSGLLLFVVLGCKKETLKVMPTLTASAVTNITSNSASAGGIVSDDGGDQVTARGVCWSSTNATPSISDSKTSDGTGIGTFSSLMSGLAQGTTYNIRAYATNSVGTAYSSASSFKTLALAPTVTTTDVSAVTATSFNSGGNVSNDGGSPVTARGICWGTNQNPTIADSKTTDSSGLGIFASSITGLSPGVTYYIRAYATNSIGTSYGNQVTTTTTAILSILTTTAVSALASTTATSGGNITNNGGAVVTARGVCWSTNQNPTITDSKTSNSTGSGSFTSLITGLTPGATYFFKAYATNSAGTAYGNEVTATTTAVIPTLSTVTASSITATTAISGGNITSDGGATVTARGVCWSTSQNPTTSDSKTSNSTGSGSFTSSITGLTPGTTYYIKAYATNSAGTGYGSQVTFTSEKTIPALTTNSITEVTSMGAVSGGTITSTGGGTITGRGICWGDAPNPTITNEKASSPAITAAFSAAIAKARPSTTYYIRAYATNEIGTGYGDQKTFTSSDAAYYQSFETGIIPAGWSGSFTVTNEKAFDGSYSLRSLVNYDSNETFTTTLTTNGQISFYYYIDYNLSSIDFYIDDVLIVNFSGGSANGWCQRIVSVTAGTHTFKWRKSVNYYYFYIDQITITK